MSMCIISVLLAIIVCFGIACWRIVRHERMRIDRLATKLCKAHCDVLEMSMRCDTMLDDFHSLAVDYVAAITDRDKARTTSSVSLDAITALMNERDECNDSLNKSIRLRDIAINDNELLVKAAESMAAEVNALKGDGNRDARKLTKCEESLRKVRDAWKADHDDLAEKYETSVDTIHGLTVTSRDMLDSLQSLAEEHEQLIRHASGSDEAFDRVVECKCDAEVSLGVIANMVTEHRERFPDD